MHGVWVGNIMTPVFVVPSNDMIPRKQHVIGYDILIYLYIYIHIVFGISFGVNQMFDKNTESTNPHVIPSQPILSQISLTSPMLIRNAKAGTASTLRLH